MSNCICNHSDYRVVYKLNYPQQARIIECLSCGLYRTLPAPVDGKLKVSDYVLAMESEAAIHMQRRIKAHKKLISVIKKKIRPESVNVLDIGCSMGHLARSFKDNGINCFGIDIDLAAIKYGYDRLGLQTLCIADSRALPFSKGVFDAVVLNHVLEHLLNPVVSLGEMHEVLKPGGLLIIILPNFRGLMARLRPLSWQGWRPDGHFWHFSPDSLTKLLKNQGFKIDILKASRMYTPLISSIVKHLLYDLISRLGAQAGQGDEIFLIASKIG